MSCEFYIGAYAIMELPKKTTIHKKKGCPKHSRRTYENSQKFCDLCGAKLTVKKTKVKNYIDIKEVAKKVFQNKEPLRYIFNGDGDYYYDEKVCIVSNIEGGLPVGFNEVDGSYVNITPQLIEEYTANFIKKHEDDLTKLNVPLSAVLFGVVSWWD